MVVVVVVDIKVVVVVRGGGKKGAESGKMRTFRGIFLEN